MRWKQIEGFEDYWVSDNGQIKSFRQSKQGKIKISTLGKKGYFVNQLRDHQGNIKTLSIHRLVALSFIPLINGKEQVNHKDGNKLNNHYSNLEWVNASENIKHAYDYLNFNPNGISVKQILNNEIIAIYQSAEEAARITHIDASSIRKVCKKKRKHAGGFNWENFNAI